MASTPKYGFPLLQEGAAKAEFTINDVFVLVDALIDKASENVVAGDNTPAPSPVNGQLFFVSATPTASTAWEGHASQCAIYYNGWIFITPVEGWRVLEKTTNLFKWYNGSSWATEP